MEIKILKEIAEYRKFIRSNPEDILETLASHYGEEFRKAHDLEEGHYIDLTVFNPWYIDQHALNDELDLVRRLQNLTNRLMDSPGEIDHHNAVYIMAQYTEFKNPYPTNNNCNSIMTQVIEGLTYSIETSDTVNEIPWKELVLEDVRGKLDDIEAELAEDIAAIEAVARWMPHEAQPTSYFEYFLEDIRLPRLPLIRPTRHDNGKSVIQMAETDVIANRIEFAKSCLYELDHILQFMNHLHAHVIANKAAFKIASITIACLEYEQLVIECRSKEIRESLDLTEKLLKTPTVLDSWSCGSPRI